ncbi:MAG: CHRD domain-containing protein [Pseudomonadota bacterium]|nr:CHRD domain-containing protein [Pseudomonadota bacterium]
MRKLEIAAALLAAFPAFVQAQGGPLRAELIGYEEVPAVATRADGMFEARVARDGQSVEYTLAYTGLQGAITQAHIHFAQKSVNGAIVVWLCGTGTTAGPTGTPTCPQSGTVSGRFTAANVLASATTQQLAAGDLATFIDAMQSGVAYVNVHTSLSPGGEIRGQVGSRGHGRGHHH